jgi:segregation and condensation protein B
MSEFAATAAPAIDEISRSDAIVTDVVADLKPKSPRKPRIKPEPIKPLVHTRKQVVRFPASWTTELRSRALPHAINPAAVKPKSAIRLPSIWVEELRVNQSKSNVHQPSVLPAEKTVKRVVRFPTIWTRELRSRATGLTLQPSISKPKSATRLPSAWAAILRVHAGQSIIVERPLPLPESSIECDVNIKRIVEAILFAANKPMTVKQIQEAFPELEQPDTLEIQTALEAIAQDYLIRPIGLIKLASGYRFQIREGMAPWVTRLFEEKPPRYSRALLETLSIIAYRQPVTRGEIEDIRGVSVSSGIIHTLLEREWIRVIAHKEVPGRPALYGTTKQFLDYFNLTSLSELPTLEEIANLDFSNEHTQQEPRERPQTHTAESESESQSGLQSTNPEVESDSSQTDREAEVESENRTLH